MQKRALVIVLALGVVLTAGCATQDMKGGSRATKDGPESNVIETVHDFSRMAGLTDVAINVYVKCIPPSSTDPATCLPSPDVFVIVTNPTQNIVFNLQGDGRTFANAGIEFEQSDFTCTRSDDRKVYTCSPYGPRRGTYLKYTIRADGAMPNDPYAFVRN
jgi:hypothetical protein